MRMQLLQDMHPPLLDHLIVTGKLPGNSLFLILGGEVELLEGHCLADVLTLHHVPGFEFNGEIVRTVLESVDLLYVQDLNRAFWQLMVRL